MSEKLALKNKKREILTGNKSADNSLLLKEKKT